jgi:UDP-3-O-[3-hydroxymyristoyl] glucosamine N-acyltransferase
VIVSQTGISGSSKVGDFVMMGGQVGVADNLTIGDGAMIAARSGVMSNIPAKARWGGFPARPRGEWLRGAAILRRLARRDGKSAPEDEA